MAGLRVWRSWRAGQGPPVPLSALPTCSQAHVCTSLWPLDDPTLPGASSSGSCWWRLGITWLPRTPSQGRAPAVRPPPTPTRPCGIAQHTPARPRPGLLPSSCCPIAKASGLGSCQVPLPRLQPAPLSHPGRPAPTPRDSLVPSGQGSRFTIDPLSCPPQLCPSRVSSLAITARVGGQTEGVGPQGRPP